MKRPDSGLFFVWREWFDMADKSTTFTSWRIASYWACIRTWPGWWSISRLLRSGRSWGASGAGDRVPCSLLFRV